jgi:hypothetical protein
MKVALICIAKNEDDYVNEWIEYHKKIGFDTIFIYQNNWRWDKNIDNVIKIEFDGNVKQVESYNHFIQNYHQEYQWGLFIDVDEFLVLKKHKNIKDLIIDYNDSNGLSINWYLFGDNNLTFTEGDFNVIKRFTKRQKNVNPHIKTLLKLSQDVRMGVHNPNISLIDTNFKTVSGSFNFDGPTDVIQLNHYFVKTKQEFLNKIGRGRADCASIRNENDFEFHNLNEFEDLTAYNFFYNDNNNLLNT